MRELLELVAHESRTKEFKSPFVWNDPNSCWLKEKTIRAILGMANTKTGGNIIVGVEERLGKLIFTGLNEEQLSSFTNFDLIKDVVDSFSYSGINFEVGKGEFNNHHYVVFRVSEFLEIPAICKRNGQKKEVLCKDDIYSRAKTGKPSTIKATELELREIIEMAADKNISKLEKRGYTKKRPNDRSKLKRKDYAKKDPLARNFYSKETSDIL